MKSGMKTSHIKIEDIPTQHIKLFQDIKDRNHLVCCHRGGASNFGPENTLYSFRKAVYDSKVDLLEIDVRVSKDNKLIIFHDDSLERTTNGSGLVSSKTVKELKTLDAAYHWPEYRGKGITISTLEEIAVWFLKENQRQELLLIIEMKVGATDMWVEKIIELYHKHPGLYDRAIVISFEPHTLYKIRSIDPKISTGIITMHDIASLGCRVWTRSPLCEYLSLLFFDPVLIFFAFEIAPLLIVFF